jgi:hypothetical protein
VKQVYKITYPTGKIYIGKDSIGSFRYMGSPNPDLVNADFANLSPDQRRDYTIRKEILWESETATEAELAAKEVEMIRAHRSNDPRIGYNRWPHFIETRAFSALNPHDGSRSRRADRGSPSTRTDEHLMIIGVDPRKVSHTATAIDPATNTATSSLRVGARLAGYRLLLGWARQYPDRRWAVENAQGLGCPLAQ